MARTKRCPTCKGYEGEIPFDGCKDAFHNDLFLPAQTEMGRDMRLATIMVAKLYATGLCPDTVFTGVDNLTMKRNYHHRLMLALETLEKLA